MRIATCIHQQQQHIGLVVDSSIILPSLSNRYSGELDDMLAVIEAGPTSWSRLAAITGNISSSCRLPLTEVELLAPIPRPHKNIMCLGLNYADHAQESLAAHGREIVLPEHPVVFTKSITSVNGPYAGIPYDDTVSNQLDWEVELGVVIGLSGRKIQVEEALNHVFGYTVINDVSARDLQFRHKQYFLGKSLDGACPMGPWIVSADEIPDPQALNLHCWVNGVLKQSSNTRHQIFSVAQTISILSHSMTLEPGDIIATGTPGGVGFARQPAEYLSPGDVVECEVERVGKIKNIVTTQF